MTILEQKARLRRRNEFGKKVLCVLFFLITLLLILPQLWLRFRVKPSIERLEGSSRSDTRVSPPQMVLLTDRLPSYSEESE